MELNVARIAAAMMTVFTAAAFGQSPDGCPITQVTSATTGESASPRISGDGSKMVFLSSSNLTGANPDGSYEIHLYDTLAGIVSQATSTAFSSWGPSISLDGNKVAFYSSANFTGGNADGSLEVFVLTVSPPSIVQATSAVGHDNDTPMISPDGTFVVYRSTADPLGTNADHSFELFVKNLSTLALIQVTSASTGATEYGVMSGDGSLVALYSTSNLTGENGDGSNELFLYDVAGASTTQVTESVGLVSLPELSADGSTLVFHHLGDLINGIPGGIFRVYEYLIATETTTEISTGVYSVFPSTTGTGSSSAYLSIADITGQNPDNNIEIFLRRASDGHVSQVTDSTTGDNQPPILSADGRWIAFYSNADLTGGNADASFEIFLARLCVFADGFESGDVGEW